MFQTSTGYTSGAYDSERILRLHTIVDKQLPKAIKAEGVEVTVRTATVDKVQEALLQVPRRQSGSKEKHARSSCAMFLQCGLTAVCMRS